MKSIFFFFEDLAWNIRCRYHFWLHGPYGLSRVVEKIPFRFLVKYLCKYGATIGVGCIIDSGFKIHRPDKILPFKNLIIGNNVYIGHNILLDLTEKILFEDDSAMGANCQIWTHVGDYSEKLRDKNDYKELVAPVIIKRGAVCYSGVLINPGVEIGEQSRVLALSMVSKIIPSKEVWYGVPAKFYKKRVLK